MKTTTPVSVSKIEIDFVNRTMTLWDWDDLVATYRPERTTFDIHIIAHDPLKNEKPVPVREPSTYDFPVPQRDPSYYDDTTNA